MLTDLKEYVLANLQKSNTVKVHITRLDTTENFDTSIGVWVNGELTEIYELLDTNNKEIDDIIVDINTFIRSNTLYLI